MGIRLEYKEKSTGELYTIEDSESYGNFESTMYLIKRKSDKKCFMINYIPFHKDFEEIILKE